MLTQLRRWIWPALFTAALVACWFAVQLTGALNSAIIGDPGGFVRWSIPVVRLVAQGAAALTIGFLVCGTMFLPGITSRQKKLKINISRPIIKAARFAAFAAGVWVVANIFLIILQFAKISGQPISEPGFTETFIANYWSIIPLRMLILSTACAATVAVVSAITLRYNTIAWMLGLALAALWPIALTGHSAGSTQHELAVTALAFHLVAATLWVGGLIALGVLYSSYSSDFRVVTQRYSWMAGLCWITITGSGLLLASTRLSSTQLFSSYGIIVLLKLMLGLGLGLAGFIHRRYSLARLSGNGTTAKSRGRSKPIAYLVIGELISMACAFGLATGLALSSPPKKAAEIVNSTVELTGYPMPDQLKASTFLGLWRMELFWLLVAVALAGLYLVGVIRLRKRGDSWPWLRVFSFLIGCFILLWITNAGPSIYARVLFSSHMLAHMTVTMIVPPLLVLGAPATLALRTLPARKDGSRGAREWLLSILHSRFLGFLSHPIVTPILFAGSLIAFYYTPLFELSLTTHTGHLLMYLHFLLTGYLFASLLIGIDPGPQRPAHALRLVILFMTMTFHAFFGVALFTGTRLLASNFFEQLNRPWGRSNILDQQFGGAITWGIGEIPVLFLAIGIAWAWVTSDERDAHRKDRQADRDGEAELKRYNQKLTALAKKRNS